jgi:hypothetical protein
VLVMNFEYTFIFSWFSCINTLDLGVFGHSDLLGPLRLKCLEVMSYLL